VADSLPATVPWMRTDGGMNKSSISGSAREERGKALVPTDS
jgi:hypothetical protein